MKNGSTYNKERYLSKKDEIKAYYEANKEKIKTYSKEYYQRNRDKYLKYSKEYHKTYKIKKNYSKYVKLSEDVKKERRKITYLKIKDYRRGVMLMRNYGITKHQYNEMFLKQEGKCAICNKHQTEFKVRFSVDHDHITGQVRSLLCHHCNTGLGNLKDSIDILERAIKYLKSHIL